MIPTLEQEETSSVLERTPHIPPFYGEVKQALAHLKNGDMSAYPIYELVHGFISAKAEAGELDQKEWHIRKVSGSTVIAHEEFLAIQDEFAQLENGSDKMINRTEQNRTEQNRNWDREHALNTLETYIEKKKKFRQRHIQLFERSLQTLDENTRSIIATTAQRFPHFLTVPENMSIVAVPSWLDNEKLWQDLGISSQLTQRIAPWSKIHEIGVVLASRIYRDDKPRGHDYFSYAARAVNNGEVDSLDQKLILTAQHEGSHGITDALLIYMLGVDAYNPIGEGMAGAIGEDGRSLKYTEVTLQQLLSLPCPEDNSLKSETAYTAGSKYWHALLEILKKHGMSMNEAWVKIFGTALQSAVELTSDSKFTERDKNSKASNLLRLIMAKLDINVQQLEVIYDRLNRN